MISAVYLSIVLGQNHGHSKSDFGEVFEAEHIRSRLELVMDRSEEIFLKALEMLPLLAISIFVVALAWFFAKIFSGWDWPFRWIKNGFIRDLSKQLFRVVVIGAGILVALELMQATALVGAVLGTAGVAGLAIGFAFKDLVENYIASVLLSLRQPFSPNDHIVVNSHEGKVLRLTSRATVLLTLDGNHVRIPNSEVFKGVILNYTKNPLRRFDIGIGVGVDENLVAASELGTDTLENMDSVLKEPGPFSRIEALGDSNVTVRFYGWVDQREADFGKAKSAATRLLKTAFDDAEIEMPEPVYRVVMTQMADSKVMSNRAGHDAKSTEPEGDTSVDTTLDEHIDEERGNEANLLDTDTELE